MNEEWLRAKLHSLEVNFHALHEMKQKLDQETIAKYQRMESRLLAELQWVRSKLTALGVPTDKS